MDRHIYYANEPFSASHWEALVEKQDRYPLGTVVRYTDGSYSVRCRRPNVMFGWLRRFVCDCNEEMRPTEATTLKQDVVRCGKCGVEKQFESPFYLWTSLARIR